MRLTCRNCGLHGSIEHFSDDAEARAFVDALRGVNGIPNSAVLGYVRLFAPLKRGMSWDKARLILGDLIAMVEAGAVEHYGKRTPASRAMFGAAIQQMLDGRDRLTLPLTSHGYLTKIIIGASPKAAADEEQRVEYGKRIESARRAGDDCWRLAVISSENARRKRFHEPAMTPEEECQLIAREARP